jgi:uncharacterized membrane protein SpoIIM required for sporulation
MNVERFVTLRADDWATLENLAQRAKGRGERLSPSEVLLLGRLYRAAAADLAVARRRFPDAPGTARLEALVAQGHGLVYGKAGRHDPVRRFVTTRFWQQVRAGGRCLALSGGILVGFVALGALWAALQPVAAVGILPAGFHASAHPGANGVVGISIPARSGLAVTIFINNIVVSLEVLAGGFTLGLLSAYVLATNGAMLGVLGMLELKAGGFAQFVRLIVPHGLLELSCIAVSGSAGFLIARALIDPGRRTRGEALTELVPLLGDTVLGVAGCLVIAGLTEGIVTTWDLPLALALGIGLALSGAFWTLVVWRGRGPGGVGGPGGPGAGTAATGGAPSPGEAPSPTGATAGLAAST